MIKTVLCCSVIGLMSAPAVMAETAGVFTVEAESNTVGDNWDANVHLGVGTQFTNGSSVYGFTAGPGYFIDPDGVDEVSVKASAFYRTAFNSNNQFDIELDMYYLTDSDRVDTKLSAEYTLLF